MSQQSDDMIWEIINGQFCSFKTTLRRALSDKTQFCRHPYSVNGICNRLTCPLANGRYATLREEDGRVYLCIKTVERAHSPKNMWEKILLSRNYNKALAQIDEHLQWFPTLLIHRNKQRLTKIHQYLIRMRKIELKVRAGKKAKLVRVHKKVEVRENRRERKALVAAKLETAIEKELVERLAKGTYGDIYNFPATPYNKALEQAAEKEEEEEEEDQETEYETEDEEDTNIEYVEDLDTDEEEEDDIEDVATMEYMGDGKWAAKDDQSNSSDDSQDDDSKPSPSHRPARRKAPRIEIEYEEEREDAQVAA